MRTFLATVIGASLLLPLASAAASAGDPPPLTCGDVVSRRITADLAMRLSAAGVLQPGVQACEAAVNASDVVGTASVARGPEEFIILLVDARICPYLALWFPPQGDIPGVWDCPPYGSDDEDARS